MSLLIAVDAVIFELEAKKRFGSHLGWQSRCAEYLGVNRSTISRYVSGKEDVPRHIALALKGKKIKKKRRT